MPRLAIEGNIGAGKSTLLSLLAQSVDFLVVPEPLSKWQARHRQRAAPPARRARELGGGCDGRGRRTQAVPAEDEDGGDGDAGGMYQSSSQVSRWFRAV